MTSEARSLPPNLGIFFFGGVGAFVTLADFEIALDWLLGFCLDAKSASRVPAPTSFPKSLRCSGVQECRHSFLLTRVETTATRAHILGALQGCCKSRDY